MPRISFAKQVLSEASAKKQRQQQQQPRASSTEPDSASVQPVPQLSIAALSAPSPIKSTTVEFVQPFSSRPSSRQVFTAKDETGLVARLATERSSNPAVPSRSLGIQVHGLRRPFGVSFGVNGKLVIPNGDGSVSMRSLPLARKSSPREIEIKAFLMAHADGSIPDETRLQTYYRVAQLPRTKLVIGFLKAVYTRRAVDERVAFADRARQCERELAEVRLREVDDWLRFAVKATAERPGLLGGDVQDELINLGSSTLDALRAATLATQGPGIGSDVIDFVAASADRPEVQSQSREIHRVSKILSGQSRFRKDWAGQDANFERQWIRAFAQTFFNRREALDPLRKVLDDYVKGLREPPKDGLFTLIQFVATYPCPESPTLLRSALMRLRDHVADWSLPWIVGQVFAKAHPNLMSKRDYALLTMSFCEQLEREKMVEWAVYVCLRGLPQQDHGDEARRKKAVCDLLTRHWQVVFETNLEKQNFLQSIGLPAEYLSHARGMSSRNDQVKMRELANCREWTELSLHVGKRLGPAIALSGRLDEAGLLIDLRTQLEAPQAHIAWSPLMKARRWAWMLGTYMKLLTMETDGTSQRDQVYFNREKQALLQALCSNEVRFPTESLCRVALQAMAKWTAERSRAGSLREMAVLQKMPLSSEARLELIARHAHLWEHQS